MAVLLEIDNNLYVGLYKGETRQILFSKEQAKKSMWDEFDVFTADGRYKVILCKINALTAQLIIYEGSNTGNRWSDRTLDIHSDSTVKARDVLEFGSLVGVSIKKI